MIYALLAQLVEHLTLNQGVQGSSPWRRTQSTVFADLGAAGAVLFSCIDADQRERMKKGITSCRIIRALATTPELFFTIRNPVLKLRYHFLIPCLKKHRV